MLSYVNNFINMLRNYNYYCFACHVSQAKQKTFIEDGNAEIPSSTRRCFSSRIKSLCTHKAYKSGLQFHMNRSILYLSRDVDNCLLA